VAGILVLDNDCERVVYRAYVDGADIVLPAGDNDLEELIGYVVPRPIMNRTDAAPTSRRRIRRCAQCRGYIVGNAEKAYRVVRRRSAAAQVKKSFSQLLIRPASPQLVHSQTMGPSTSARRMEIRPRQRRLPGRRRHGSALVQVTPTSPALAARTKSYRYSADAGQAGRLVRQI